jgi:hypothetical protein
MNELARRRDARIGWWLAVDDGTLGNIEVVRAACKHLSRTVAVARI